MDSSMENLSPKQMMEQIAELRHSMSQLKEANKKMIHWLDVADDDDFHLRSQNTSMMKRIKSLEKLLREKAHLVAHLEAETSRLPQGNDLDAEKINAQKMNKMEKEVALMMEENQKLTAELRSLQEEKEKDQDSIRSLRADLATMKWCLEKVMFEKQQKDEIIHQKTLQLKNFEEAVGQYTNIIEVLRLKNQELKRQFEEGLETISIAVLNESAAENEGALSRPLSIAQEIQLQEKEAALMEENQKLTAEMRSLQEEKEKDQANRRDITTDLATLKCCLEEFQLVQERNNEIIHQDLRLTNQDLKRQLEEALERTPQSTDQGSHLIIPVKEETTSTFHSFNIKQDLRLTNQDLKRQLEEALERTPQSTDQGSHLIIPVKEETTSTFHSFNIKQDLRLTNQDLKRQLEEALERTPQSTDQGSHLIIPVKEETTSTFHSLNIKQNEGALSRPLSIAQEIQLQEKEAALMEENQKLTAEMRSLQEEKEKDQANRRDITTDLATLKCCLEQFQLVQERNNEIIHQDLRLTNQDLKRQLEEALERTPQSTDQGSHLIIPVKEETTSTFHSLNIKQEETEPEDETKPSVVHQRYQCNDQSCAEEKKEESSGWSWTFGLMSMFIFFLLLVVFVAPRSSYLLCPLLRELFHVLQPHVSLTYISSPPV